MDKCVSVLMCVYNTPLEYLKEAVDSILSQTYKNFEFIIVDDCSDDEKVIQYLSGIAKENESIAVLRNSQNIGLTKSLNVGLDSCCGDYIARMDSDDISLPERLSRQVEYLDSNMNVALVGSDIICFGKEMSELDTSHINNPCDDYETYQVRSLIQHSGPPHPTFMFRRNFLMENNIRYREDILKAQDYGIMTDIMKCGGVIKKLHFPLLKYRIHSGQISANAEIEQKLYQLRVSFDYVKAIFSELTNEECLSIALLGCEYGVSTIKQCIESNDSLRRVFSDIEEVFDLLHKPNIYINAQKKIFSLNEGKKFFDDKKLKYELSYKWWKRALHSYKEYGAEWLINMYTILSYRYVIIRIIRKRKG